MLGFKVTVLFLGAAMSLQNEMHITNLSGPRNRSLNIENYGQNMQAYK